MRRRRPVSVAGKDGKTEIIGFVQGDVFTTYRTDGIDMFRNGARDLYTARKSGLAAWGLVDRVAEGLLKKGVKEFRIVSNSGVYTVSLQKLVKEGYQVEKGSGRGQYFLPLSEYKFEPLGFEEREERRMFFEAKATAEMAVRKRGQRSADVQTG